MYLKSTLLIVSALALSVSAQQPKPLQISEDQAVPNDDRGQAFIIQRNAQPLSFSGRSRKGTISEPQQYSIFLGSGWSTSAMRERESTLSRLLANVSSEAELLALQGSGIKNRFGPTLSTERLDAGPGDIADLDVQRLLAAAVEDGTLPRPTMKTIYVVFLDADLKSTLGSLAAGKHYAAYHSVFTASGTSVRYVVVPFESDADAARRIALRALVAAALKPGSVTPR